MTIRDRVVQLLREKGPLEDSAIAATLGILHQQANHRCRQLVQLGLAVREPGSDGRLVTRLVGLGANSLSTHSSAPPKPKPSMPLASPPGLYTDQWFWEGNVQRAIARSLLLEGWSLLSEADTASKAHGVDLLLEDGERRLAIEVKGYPPKGYADPKRAHERKRTSPTAQADKWYSHALLKAVRMLSQMPGAEIAMGFPDFPRYRSLARETERSLKRLGIGMYLVSESEAVTPLLPHRRQTLARHQDLPLDAFERDA